MAKTIYQQWLDGERSGEGSFHTALFNAYKLADDNNRKKIELGFPELFKNYSHMNPEAMLKTCALKAQFETLTEINEEIEAIVASVVITTTEQTLTRNAMFGKFNLPTLLRSASAIQEGVKDTTSNIFEEIRELVRKGGYDE